MQTAFCPADGRLSVITSRRLVRSVTSIPQRVEDLHIPAGTAVWQVELLCSHYASVVMSHANAEKILVDGSVSEASPTIGI